MAWRVMIPKKISTMFSHEQPVGVKCRMIRWFYPYRLIPARANGQPAWLGSAQDAAGPSAAMTFVMRGSGQRA
jgi:hypothetical protein